MNEFGYSHQDVFINDGGLTKVFGAYDLENLINTTKFIREDLEASALIFEWDGAPATIIFILKKFSKWIELSIAFLSYQKKHLAY